MRDVSKAVARISGRGGNGCYAVLCHAVEAALACLPREFPMGEICRDTARLCGKSESAVSKSLSRAARDCWEYGDRRELCRLFGHTVVDKPSPRDLIAALCHSLADAATPLQRTVAYTVLESSCPKRYGILGQAIDAEAYLIAAPFCQDEAWVANAVAYLNREQVPIQTFKTLFLAGRVFPPTKDGPGAPWSARPQPGSQD